MIIVMFYFEFDHFFCDFITQHLFSHSMSYQMPAFRNINFNQLEADEIIGFIVKKHHGYEVRMLELLNESCEKAVKADSHISPELFLVSDLLAKFSEKALLHIRNEEEILFPYIKKLLEIKRAELQLKFLNINLSKSTLKLLSREHAELLKFWNEIKMKTNGFEPFKGASPITKLFFAELLDFESDLINHFYLEDKILFPKLSALEKNVNELTEIAIRRVPGE